MTEVLEVLKKGRSKLRERGWRSGYNTKAEGRVCIVQALQLVGDHTDSTSPVGLAIAELNLTRDGVRSPSGPYLGYWNDAQQSDEPVFELLNTTISRLEAVS